MRKTILTLAGVVMLSVMAYGQIDSFDIADGGWNYRERALRTGRTGTGGGSADFTAGTDNLFQNWIWYRSSNDTREYGFSNQNSGSFAGNSATLSYTEPTAGGSITARMVYTLTEISATSAIMVMDMFLVHNGGTEVIDIYFYADFDVAGSTQNTGNLLSFGSNSGMMKVTNPTAGVDAYFGVSSADGTLKHWEMDRWSLVRAKLADSDRDDLRDGDDPFALADWTGAFQWSNEMGDGSTARIRMFKGINAVPEPATMVILGAGLAALAARRRRK